MSQPYAEALGARDAAAVIGGTAVRLRVLMDRFTAEQRETRPAPGKWSLREIMCHMADTEIAWAWRLRSAYEQEHGVLQSFEQDPWARMYGQYSFALAWETFAALRAWNVAFVAGLTEADKRKPVTHTEHGAWELWTLVRVMAGHDLHHLAALEKVVEGS